MMQATDPASLPLRDIHLPDAVSWWPPALGWWLLCLLIIIITSLIIYVIRRRRNHRLSAVYLAQQELDKIKNDFVLSQDKASLVKDLSELIRRVSISLFKRIETASLTGQDWLNFLDKFTSNNEFSQGIGRVLIEAPYQAEPEYDSEKLLQLISSWIETVSNNKGRQGS